MTALLRKALFDLRWQVFWYGFGLTLYAGFVVLHYPSFEDTLLTVEYPEEFLQFFGGAGADLSRPDSFIELEFFGQAPIVVIVYAVFASTGALAGGEGRGTLETLLAQPVSRARLFGAKVGAAALGLLGITALVSVGCALSVPFVDLHGVVTLPEVVAAQALTLPLVFFWGAWGLFLGAVAPSRGQAAGMLGAIVLVAYLASLLAQAVEPIGWVRYASPYYYGDTTRLLSQGAVWWHQAALLAGGALGAGLALLAFEGREIGSGRWQFGARRRGLAIQRREAGPSAVASSAS